MSEELDLESCWQDIRHNPFDKVPDPTKFQDSLKKAYERSSERIAEYINKNHHHAQLTGEVFATIIGQAISIFMEEWHNGLREENLAGLVELILEGQELTASEMNDFVRALPYSLLERICKSAVKSATGIHGLMAIEYARRNRTIPHYGIIQDGSRAYVEFTEANGRQVKFYLDEKFEVPNESV
jgi:hypothetical protein